MAMSSKTNRPTTTGKRLKFTTKCPVLTVKRPAKTVNCPVKRNMCPKFTAKSPVKTDMCHKFTVKPPKFTVNNHKRTVEQPAKTYSPGNSLHSMCCCLEIMQPESFQIYGVESFLFRINCCQRIAGSKRC